MLQSVGPQSKFYPSGVSVPMLDAPVPVLPHFRGFRLVIEHAVTLVFGVHTGDLQLARRGRAQVALARQTGMYLAHVGFSLSLTEVGFLFERDRTTVAHACALIEDRRDDRDFDRALELLERAVRAMRQPSFRLLPAP